MLNRRVSLVVGAYSRKNESNVNACKNKKSTNVHSADPENTLNFTLARKLTLKEALEYIGEDKLVENTPKSIRLRKDP